MIRSLMTSLAVAASLLASPTTAQDDEPSIGARLAAAEDEREMLAVFRDVPKGDPAQLAEAITALGEASRRLEDGGSSRAMTKALASGFDEDDIAPRRASVVELMWGRDPATTIGVLEDALDDAYNEIQKRVTRPDDESRVERRDFSELYALACRALSYHPDDRAVDVLTDQLREIRPAQQGNNISAFVLTPAVDALLTLGHHDGVELVVRKTGEYLGPYQTGNAKRLHDSLATFANRVGYAPPPLDDKFDQGWRDWFDAHEDEFPKSLGRLDEPTARPAELGRRRDMTDDDEPIGPRRP